MRLAAAVNDMFDRSIGAAGLSPEVRRNLLRQQVDSIGRMLPVLVAASLVVALTMLALTWRTALFWPLLAVTGVIALMGLHSIWLAPDQSRGKITLRPIESASRGVIYSAVLGTLWGVVINVLPLAEGGDMRAIAATGIGGLVSIAIMALLTTRRRWPLLSFPCCSERW